jgi:hypothetical protein
VLVGETESARARAWGMKIPQFCGLRGVAVERDCLWRGGEELVEREMLAVAVVAARGLLERG